MSQSTPADQPRMRILALGLPRCATSSLKAAFESPTLDCAPCMHQGVIGGDMEKMPIVVAAMNERDAVKRQEFLHQIFDGFAATSDYPGMMFADDLMDMYPDAVVVLNSRAGGGEAWSKSMHDALGFFGTWTFLIVCGMTRTTRINWWGRKCAERKWRGRHDGLIFDEPASYEAHNAWVREEAKKRGREILEWKAEDGYAPLCKVLGRPEPGKEVSFPRLNDTANMRMYKKMVVKRGLKQWASVGLLGVTVWAGVRWGPLVVGRVMNKL